MQNRRTLVLRPRKYSEATSDSLPALYFCHKSSASLSTLEQKVKREAKTEASTSEANEALSLDQHNLEEETSKVASFFDFLVDANQYEEDFRF